MTTPAPKSSPGNFFEDFRLGQSFRHATPRTDAVARLRKLVESGDEEGFALLMLKGRAYVEGRAAVRG